MLKFEEALRIADEELDKALYNGEWNAHLGIRKIFRKKADWLAPVVYLAKLGLEQIRQKEKNDGK